MQKMTTRLILLALVLSANICQLLAQCECNKPSMFIDSATVAQRTRMFNDIRRLTRPGQQPSLDSLELDGSFFDSLSVLLEKDSTATGIRMHFATYSKSDAGNLSDSYFPNNYDKKLTLILTPTGTPLDQPECLPPSGKDSNVNYQAININQQKEQRGILAPLDTSSVLRWIEGYESMKPKRPIATGNYFRETRSTWFPRYAIINAAEVIECLKICKWKDGKTRKVDKIRIRWVAYSDQERKRRPRYDKRLSFVFLLLDKSRNLINLADLNKIDDGLDTGIPCPPDSCNDDPNN
jgi:hypothetical protein